MRRAADGPYADAFSVAFAASYADSPRAAEPSAADRFDGGEDAATGEKKPQQRPRGTAHRSTPSRPATCVELQSETVLGSSPTCSTEKPTNPKFFINQQAGVEGSCARAATATPRSIWPRTGCLYDVTAIEQLSEVGYQRALQVAEAVGCG